MQIIKKGLYKFIVIPRLPGGEMLQNLTFISGAFKSMYVTDTAIYYVRRNGYEFEVWNNSNVWTSPYENPETSAQLIMIDADQEVEDAFYLWFSSNTNRAAASIKYNGSIVSTMFASERATLNCEGSRMIDDIIIETSDVFGGTELVSENLDEELDDQISLLTLLRQVLLYKIPAEEGEEDPEEELS